MRLLKGMDIYYIAFFVVDLHLLLLHCSRKLLTKICCKIGLNFIRLLRVVITPLVAERRKRLEAIG